MIRVRNEWTAEMNKQVSQNGMDLGNVLLIKFVYEDTRKIVLLEDDEKCMQSSNSTLVCDDWRDEKHFKMSLPSSWRS